MSNHTATFSCNLSFTNPLNSPAQLSPPVTVQASYAGQNEGAIDVPDGTASSTAYSVPFGSVTVPTGVLIRNLTANGTNPGVDILVVVNSAGGFTLPPGGVLTYFSPVVDGPTTPISSVDVTTETGPQVGAGVIGYYVFGDPV